MISDGVLLVPLLNHLCVVFAVSPLGLPVVSGCASNNMEGKLKAKQQCGRVEERRRRAMRTRHH